MKGKVCEIGIQRRTFPGLMAIFLAFSLLLTTAPVALASYSDEGDGITRIFLLDAPFLTWDDIDPDTTPNLDSILDEAAIANLVARSTVRTDGQTATPNETAASLSKGWWMQDLSSVSVGERVQLDESAESEETDGGTDGETESQTDSDTDAAQASGLSELQVTYAEGKTFSGRLGKALAETGSWTTAAIGCSDIGDTAIRPAAISVADGDGVVDLCASVPEISLISSDSAPGGWITDYDALDSLVTMAVEDSGDSNLLLAIDTGDLYRAGCARIEEPSEEAEAAWSQALASFDQTLGHVLELMDSDDSLIIYSTLSGSTEADHSDDTYSPLVILSSSMSGVLASPITGRTGIVTVLDLTDTIAGLAGIDELSDDGGMLYTSQDSSDRSSDVRESVEELDRSASYGWAIDQSLDNMSYIFVGVLAISFACSVVMLSRLKLPIRALEILIPVTRLLWILTMSYPLATYLMYPFAQDGITPEGAMILCSITTLVIAFVAILFGRFTKWLYSMLFLMAATVVVLVVDQLMGGILAQTGYLSYRPIDAVRFSGIGNEGAAVLFGAWLLLSGLVLNRYPDKRTHQVFGKWLFPLLSLAIISVIVSPWWGANFGVLVWGVVGTGATWWMFIGRRLTWRVVIITVVACGALTILLILADGLFGGGQSHLGATAANLMDYGLAYIPVIIDNMLTLSIATILYDPVLSIALVFIWLYLAWLRITKPGPYRIFWDRNTFFKASFTSAMIAAVVMLLIEDSGILLPALMLLYATAGLTWLICDLHRWELKAAESERGMSQEVVDTPIGGFKVE